MDTQYKEKILKLLNKCEKYFYKYLLTHDKAYIDHFFTHTKKIKRLIKLWTEN